jgi:predicted CxxxxCH...CXXCH cytochrome family protein
MTIIKFLLTIAFAGILFLVACSDLQENLPPPVSNDIRIHQEGWNADPSSASFHGKYLKIKEWDLTECKPCHGSSSGGGVSGKSCFNCHSAYPHVEGWEEDTSIINFHGKYIKLKDWSPVECKLCHGTSYDGGMSDVTCFSCHFSFPHEIKFSGEDGHAGYMENNGYPFDECKDCHGDDLNGGVRVKISCASAGCHVDGEGNAKSPEACNTCHGRFRAAVNDTLSWAPPRSLNGDTLTTSHGVGAHQAHLTGVRLSSNAQCIQCHTVPSDVFSNGHLGSDPPAELVFNSTIAALITADGTFIPNPTYDALRCSGVYCHGSWKLRRASSLNNWVFTDSIMAGAAFSPLWTGGISEAECGSCHGLPPSGHQGPYAATACGTCHTDLDGAPIVDATGAIKNKSKHINGKVNVLRAERPF